MSTIVAEHSRLLHLPALPLVHGATVARAHLAWESWGCTAAPAVLVLGGISAGRHLLPTDGDPRPGWWPDVAGPDGALDPGRFHLLAIDYIGGRGDSWRPAAGDPWPAIGTADQAAAVVRLLDALGITRLHAAVGASYGGMVALALAERYPARVGRVVALCAAHRAHPMATALRSIQRRVIHLAAAQNEPDHGVAVARALAMATYRSATEFADRFSGDARVVDGVARFPVDEYLDHHGREYAGSFPADALVALSQSIDLHRVDPRRITVPCSLVGFDTDTLVPVADMRTLARTLAAPASFTCIRTRFGHDGFLKEATAVNAAIRAGLDDSAAPAAATRATRYAARAGSPDRCASATAAVRAGIGSDTQHGAVIPPIQLSTTFTFAAPGAKRTYDYTRSGNPTRDLLAAAIAELEHGAAGLVTPTGMSAIAVVLHLLEPGDLLIAPHDGYGGTYRLLNALAARGGFRLELMDLTRADAAARVRSHGPRMVWIETPSNPLLRITDIARIAGAAHAAGALCVADNTFLSPALQTPIDLGADIVIHSTTKYLNGHSDVVGGAIVAGDVELAEELGWWANCTGATGAPFDSYLTLRGLRTLHPRMRAHLENAAAVVDLLGHHDAVRAVHYPGLHDHPGHETAGRQQRGWGAMVSFQLAGGADVIPALVSRLRHFSLAESLGGVESLIAHPATMTHAAMDAGARRTAGIGDDLLRVSVGIEDTADLVSDLRGALDAAT